MFLEKLLDLGKVGRDEGLVRRDDVLVSTDGFEHHLLDGRRSVVSGSGFIQLEQLQRCFGGTETTWKQCTFFFWQQDFGTNKKSNYLFLESYCSFTSPCRGLEKRVAVCPIICLHALLRLLEVLLILIAYTPALVNEQWLGTFQQRTL